MSVYSWIKNRERDHKSNALTLKRHLWNTLYRKSDEIGSNSHIGYNGIFGLKYSPNGRYLVAACEKDAIVVIDPHTSKIVCERVNVHTKRCNTVTFIDERLFATCSDDSNISLWDIRNLSEEVLQLSGHSGWVKNVEYHKPTKCLVSASFDDQILLWDINSPSPNGKCESSPLLRCANLMRMRLSPDGKSMYISTMQTADLIAIHNLNLDTLHKDINEISCVGQYGDHSIAFNNREIVVDRSDKYHDQSQPISTHNHLELYYGYNTDEKVPCTVFCQSIDVHPDNLAIALRYDRLSSSVDKYTSIHNTWSYYSGKRYGNNSWLDDEQASETYLPLPRGSATNYAREDNTENVEYIQEICFSPCGRLVASPFGYGIRLMSLDASVSDYRSHIAHRASLKHQWDDTSDKVTPAYTDVEPQKFNDVLYCFGHRSMVLSTCFSPINMQVASGSKNGKIIIYDPIL